MKSTVLMVVMLIAQASFAEPTYRPELVTAPPSVPARGRGLRIAGLVLTIAGLGATAVREGLFVVYGATNDATLTQQATLMFGSEALVASGAAMWATGELVDRPRRPERAKPFTVAGATLLGLGLAATAGSIALLAAQRCYDNCSEPSGIGDAIAGDVLANVGSLLTAVGAPVLAIGVGERRPKLTLSFGATGVTGRF